MELTLRDKEELDLVHRLGEGLVLAYARADYSAIGAITDEFDISDRELMLLLTVLSHTTLDRDLDEWIEATERRVLAATAFVWEERS